ncbi:ABC transporter permease [Neorhizobium sp. P12A]|uniref:ABC transporter permease n=1 Tax=Rhizobium/Agrobacterium group TaxID=227290 RepID=UPI00104AAD5F|nr:MULTISPECIES: ABC transporter permease [Rhizobium/Agrobacterium group]KAA0697824.1 ABC transporter permease [Neorhizobium sp. P12A]TCR87973.1 peptide/nickel transport system permease protein [Rhizobium sp. BK376]
MPVYILRRLFQALFVVIVVTLLVSYAIRLSGDPTSMLMSGGGAISEDDLQHIRDGLGLNQPFHMQYIHFLEGILTGDFGRSFFGGGSVWSMIAQALPATLLLAFLSLILSFLISIPLGIHAAVKAGSLSDQLIRILSLVGLSFPNFWLAIMLVLIFSIKLNLLPASGFLEYTGLVMPVVTLALILSAVNVRIVRSAMLETLSTQYILVSRAKGLKDRVVLYKHALRNCLIPLLTFVGLQFGDLLGGVVIVERVFNWPGMGSLAFDAISSRDYPVLQGVITVMALLIVITNLLIDVAYGIIDPRIGRG